MLGWFHYIKSYRINYVTQMPPMVPAISEAVSMKTQMQAICI